MKLTRDFYSRSVLTVAPDLLGKYLVFHSPQGKFVGEINEVEAYRGIDDPASHAYRGQTLRNAVMFGEGGYAYVYFIYGMYDCLNVVTGAAGVAEAVLIRSVIPIEGEEIMRKNRHNAKHLTDGPGKLCQAFGITREQNGIDLVTSDVLYIEDRGKVITQFQSTPRIGINVAQEKLWRFCY